MRNILIAVMISIIAAVAAAKIVVSTSAVSGYKETAFERVMRTGKLRCGYFSWYPAVIKDPETGAFKGIFYDYVNELGKSLNLQVEWAEEVSLGEYPAALHNGRIDAFCGATWITGERARAADFITPVYYLPLYAFSKEGDTRFDANLDILNDPQYSIAVLEGGATATIQRKMFPDARPYELPQFTSPSELFVSLAQGKADVAIYDLFTYGDYNTYNPGKVRRVSAQPIKVFPNVIAVDQGENELRQMLSHATLELHLSGMIEKMIARHEKYPGAIYRMAMPYRE